MSSRLLQRERCLSVASSEQQGELCVTMQQVCCCIFYAFYSNRLLLLLGKHKSCSTLCFFSRFHWEPSYSAKCTKYLEVRAGCEFTIANEFSWVGLGSLLTFILQLPTSLLTFTRQISIPESPTSVFETISGSLKLRKRRSSLQYGLPKQALLQSTDEIPLCGRWKFTTLA